MKYRVLSVAGEELSQAISFYERQSKGLGWRFLDEYEAAVQRILNCPEAWTSISPNQRRCLFRQFPFAVLYSFDGRELLITGVMDLRRNPRRQQDRLRDT